MERLQHGFAAVSVVATFAIATFPVSALGQIITESEPYQQVDSNPPVQQSTQSTQIAIAELSQLDLAFLRARQAMAYGDVESAIKYLQMAESFDGEQSQFGDSVQLIKSLVNGQNDLAKLAADKDTSYNARAAEFLLQQATALVKFGDFETTEVLVGQAKKFPVDFKTLSVTPDAVMTALANAKTNNVSHSDPTQLAVTNVLRLMSQAQLAFDQGDLEQAKSLTGQARQLGVADTKLPANQVLPWQMDLKIQDAMRSGEQVVAVSYEKDDPQKVVQADYDPAKDKTKNVLVSATAPASGTLPAGNTEFAPSPGNGMQMFEAGMTALRSNDIAGARQFFEQAWQNRDQLDPAVQQTVQDQLTNLPNSSVEELPNPESDATNSQSGESFIADADDQEQFRKLQSEVFRQRAAAERIRDESPRAAIDLLTQMRSRVSQSEVSERGKRALFTMVDRDIAEFQKFIKENISDIQLREDNAAVMADVRESREKRYNTELQIQKLVEEFNDLMDEQRYFEARSVAFQVEDLDPQSEIASLLKSKATIQINNAVALEIKEEKEQAFVTTLNDVDRDTINNVSETAPVAWGDRDIWARNATIRDEWLSNRQYRTPAERKIWNLLKNEQVQGHYQGTLSEAVNQISESSGVNIIFDQLALTAESVTTSSIVDIPIHQPISLESALNIILGQSGLVFVVEDEVIKVTSRDAQRRDVKPKTYYVGDLVTPIQNFQHSLSMNFMTPQGSTGQNGIVGMSNSALGRPGSAVPLASSSSSLSPVDLAQQSVMAQQGLGGALPGLGGLGGGPVQSGTPTYSSFGPQSPGGVTEADFQPLINLIRNTIDPDGWDDTNGDGTVQAFVPNLSLIVSQTQAVQDQIQDLLQQLRELNDVQIVVEVRFVSLSDGFFERIGIDFDFNLNDNSGINPAAIPEQVNPSAVVGLQTGDNDATPFFSPDLDIPFQQTFFQSTIPQAAFGGFDPGSAANFGFAILSDIEVFFLIQAAKGDTRTNITQAPTLTMFNGQVASVNDGATRPFVTSVTPVVGDFAVAQQPIITLLPEGASLNVQAVVSNDRKSVRMTLVPFFSQITAVDTFTFDGSTSTQRSTDQNLIDDLLGAVTGMDANNDDDGTEFTTATEGVTIQLPTLGFTSVSTVVSVPDGGTILLGGVKRQAEQRIERGVPFLSNIPYVSRLFKNVGIGRDTSSLMLMVSPRIIIQEEEELEQVGTTSRSN